MPTQALNPGSSAIVESSIPAACYDASQTCHFTIGVDSTSTVIESNEVNNDAAGICGASIQ
jgi:subtilase family serine protease